MIGVRPLLLCLASTRERRSNDRGQEVLTHSNFPVLLRVTRKNIRREHAQIEMSIDSRTELSKGVPIDPGIGHTNVAASLPRGRAITNEPQSSKGLPS